MDKERQEKIESLQALYYKGDMGLVIPAAQELVRKYQSATAVNILALAHKRQGNIDQARQIFEQVLVDNPTNTLFLGNLGNIYTDTGKLEKAEECYLNALEEDPSSIGISVSLANVYALTARPSRALKILHQILSYKDRLTYNDLDDINFKIAEIYRDAGSDFYDKAIEHYSRSGKRLSSSLWLELIYRSKDKKTYSESEEKILKTGEVNPLLAAVQTHASIRYKIPDRNLFCREPLSYIKLSKLSPQDGFNHDLVDKLLKSSRGFDAKPQELLKSGSQTSGNVFLSSDPAFRTLKTIIFQKIEEYRSKFSESTDGFITKWPKNSELHGWIVDMKGGGLLKPHMHKLGWLSGSLYLSLKKISGSNAGNIVFDLKGASYPSDSKDFPSMECNISQGDIVMFPSSLFHYTVASEKNERRISLAFDVKPID
ncbi:MAG: hypothetical protein CL568_00915 [Alphaproteobacteria bacterium]|nr:hypothetical protein [Alphaproteobacteria bacterium]PPR13567.1 MAG: hypothetical protein CFH42_01319 [Alphaproteobacteria bacterium MarineAlpha12_Bin1]|tara:strand:+ start:5832 stop:7115 length:1284 start_codon:yes stop_codon:yes gene_type:complete